MAEPPQRIPDIVWPWRERAAREEAARRDRDRARRRLGVAQGLVGGAVASLLVLVAHRPLAATVVAAIAGLSAALALASPGVAYPYLERAVAGLGRLLGGAVRWILFPPIFILLFWPLGAFRRWRGQSPIARHPDPAAASYWRPARQAAGAEGYRRQF